jgi:hypothetical protein
MPVRSRWQGAEGRFGTCSPPQEPSGGRRGRLEEHIVEKKVGEMKDYMERVAALVHEYVPPNPQKIQAAQGANLRIPSRATSGTAPIAVGRRS